ncbi:MAG TPA: efflux transporter outer membrane subunit [Gallionellaceae bacterium]|nr:efflux transporter outer membrane subunit [Gallionellaceae bacterium]
MINLRCCRFNLQRVLRGSPGRAAATAAAALFLHGCAAGPDFKRPAAPTAQTYTPAPVPATTASADVQGGAAQHFDPNRDIPFDWWTLFRSPQLNALIARAFKANPDIASAQAALRQAQAYVTAQRGYFYPTVGAGFSPSRTKLAGNMGGNSPGVQGNGHIIQTYSNPAGPAPYNGPAYYNFYTAQVNVGYVPDVFGGNRRAVESAQAQAEAQRYALEATYITLASNIVAAALQEAALRAQIAATEKIVSSSQEDLAIMRKQKDLGYVSALDVAQQASAAAEAEQALIPLRKQLAQTRDLIRALAGNPPDKDVPETFELSSLHLPEALPLSLPSRLVEQRPDVRMAEAQLHAASAEYGVSIANRLPQFAITGAAGGNADALGWMFRTGGGFFDLALDVSQVLFDGGTLRAKSHAAQEAMHQAGAQYRSTVITAIQNVADTLYAIQYDADALKAAADSEQAMRLTRDITQKQYAVGYVSYQQYLVAEQNYQQTEIALVQAQTNRYGDTAALYQALGGGWWNRDKAGAAPTSAPQPAAAQPAAPAANAQPAQGENTAPQPTAPGVAK